MAKNNNLSDFLTDVADGIRAKKGTTAPINAQNFRSEIESISTLPAGVSVSGTEITIDTDQYTAVIAGQDGDDQTGKVVISGLEIPVELDPNVDSSVQVTNLTPANVKKDVTILGVTGTLESGGETVRSVKILLDATKNAKSLFKDYGGSTIPDGALEYSDTSNVTSMYQMFSGCLNLTSVPQLDVGNVTSMHYMFSGCKSLTTVPQLNAGKVTTMQYMFSNCSSLTTISPLITSSVTNMQNMFNNCSGLTTIPQLDTSNVTSMASMFNGCFNLTEVPQLDTSKVTDTRSMFYSCRSLRTIPLLDTSNVTTMNGMFTYCSLLLTLPQLNTSNVTTMNNMFFMCERLSTIPLLDTSKVTNMSKMFNGCANLQTIPQLDVGNVTDMSDMFGGCHKLKSILMYGMKVNFNIAPSTQFERADLVTILNNLATVTSSTTLTMGATNLAKLTDEDKLIATNKGWTLA